MALYTSFCVGLTRKTLSSSSREGGYLKGNLARAKDH
jgi:hypothetical protein